MLFAPPGFVHYDYTKLFPKLEREVPELQKFVLVEDLGGKYKFSGKAPTYVSYEDYLQQYEPAAQALPKVEISPHDMVNVQFTSGSTGLPKNVALSHYNIMNCGRYIWQQVKMTDEDRVCLPVPLFHSFGMIVGECISAAHGSLYTRRSSQIPRYQLQHSSGISPCAPERVVQRSEGAPLH